LLRKRLFKPDVKNKQETRQSLAAEEAVKVKRCLQALRYLWRNAKDNSHDPSVQAMKEYLCESPLQTAGRENPLVVPSPSDDEQEADESPAPAEPMSPGDVGFGGDVGGCDSGFSDDENGESENDGESDDGLVCPPSGRVVQTAIRAPTSDDEESLNAPTLQLASQSPKKDESSDEDLRDSQVSSGWLGKFYATYGRFGKDENSDIFPKSVHRDDKQGMLDDILASLMGADEDIDK